VRNGRQIVDLGPGRMKDLLAGGAAALERARKATGPLLEERAIRYLPPVPDADKFLCVGKNHRQHLEELRANELLAECHRSPRLA
jgi:5-carboxymethyl-2-hydroxymuconate isomerase/acylpyruvate hydrolase